ncbi:hypothetical protein A0J48_010250 [Sphaerospermopsis aphanizomenoides BCCUSP55]|uniref:hypothetical protein n=1 Tax=Sphaerospermopsis aphanizomenoides TaxID=459663 RepID=UPI001907D27D|nr:hypothetical protein [Sphaerospermopsis aphanizomenoides]MBK1987916.1 hypothetical protein [Sphaerospermopsis aphanizomenoides BCCUSP55]
MTVRLLVFISMIVFLLGCIFGSIFLPEPNFSQSPTKREGKQIKQVETNKDQSIPDEKIKQATTRENWENTQKTIDSIIKNIRSKRQYSEYSEEEIIQAIANVLKVDNFSYDQAKKKLGNDRNKLAEGIYNYQLQYGEAHGYMIPEKQTQKKLQDSVEQYLKSSTTKK